MLVRLIIFRHTMLLFILVFNLKRSQTETDSEQHTLVVKKCKMLKQPTSMKL